MTRSTGSQQSRGSARQGQIFRDLRSHNERRAQVAEIQRERRLDRERLESRR